MTTQNLAVTQYVAKDEIYLIADVKPTDKLIWISEDGILIKRSYAPGEMSIVEDTSVTVHLTTEDTGRLSVLGSTLSLQRLGNKENELLFDGAITVTAGTPPSFESAGPVELVSNSWDDVTTNQNIDLGGKHNLIFLNPANMMELNARLSSAISLKTKRFIIKNVGQGTVSVRKPDNTEFINLDPTEKVIVYARGLTHENDWQIIDS